MIFDALTHLLDRQVGRALLVAREFSEQVDDGNFDLESASLLTGMWIRISNQEVELEEMMPVLSKLGMRHCTTRSSTEILVSMTEKHEKTTNEFRECHSRIFNVAETAMRHSMRGTARTAVELLIQQGETTRNAKLIDMAGAVLKRHAEKIDDAIQLGEQITALHERYVKPMGGLVPSRARDTGGVALRV
jgi:hypothetical protein